MGQAKISLSSVLSWFRSRFCYWYGQKLFKKGRREESKKYFRQLLREKRVRIDYLAAAHFYLGEIERWQGNRSFAPFYKKSLSYILPKKEKTRQDLYFIARIYKRLRNYKKARQWFERILNSKGGTYWRPEIYFHLGEMAFFERRYNDARIFFEKTLSLVRDHGKAADYLMVIENKKR